MSIRVAFSSFLASLLAVAALVGLIGAFHLGASPSAYAAPVTALPAVVANIVDRSPITSTIYAGEGEDFASIAFGDAWDMDKLTDIYNERTGNAVVSVQDGLLTGISAGGAPNIWLLWPGFGNRGDSAGYAKDPVEDGGARYGAATPINADHYRYLIVRLFVDTVQPGDGGRVYWVRNNSQSAFGLSKPFYLQSGWRTYTLDLATLGTDAGTEGWNGQVQGLRIDPTNRAGVNFKIDWIRLIPASGPQTRIEWTPTNGLTSLWTQPNPDEPALSTITDIMNAEEGVASWNSFRFPPDSYPVVQHFGTDYAALSRQDVWDMAAATDIVESHDLSDLTVENGVMRAFVTGSDAQLVLPMGDADVDPSLFNTFSFRMRVDITSTANVYWELFWFREGTVLGSSGQRLQGPPSGDPTGWQTYFVKMDTFAPWYQAGKIDRLRLDPVSGNHLISRTIEIDWIGLTDQLVAATSEAELINTATMTHSVIVQEAPMARITAPGWTSGQDYAGTVLGNDWGMDQLTDVITVTGDHILSRSAKNGILTAVDDTHSQAVTPPRGCVTQASSPGIGLNTGWTSTPKSFIDPVRYPYLTYRLGTNVPQNPCQGTASRVTVTGLSAVTSTLAAVISSNFTDTYHLNMAGIGTLSGGNWASYNGITGFTLRPNEVPGQQVTNSLDYVKLTSRPWADQHYGIRWQTLSAGGPATVTLFYQPVATSALAVAARTEITKAHLSDGWLLWDTSKIPAGEYIVSMEMDDGLAAVRTAVSPVPVVIKRSPDLAFRPFAADIFLNGSPVTRTVTWTLVNSNADSRINLYVEPISGTVPISIAHGLSGNQTSFAWRIYTDTLALGTYRLFATIDDHVSPVRRIPYGQFVRITNGAGRSAPSGQVDLMGPASVLGQRDSGLRPAANGYAFANYSVTNSVLNTPATVETLIQMFGADAVCKPGTLNQDGRSCTLDAGTRALLNAIIGDGLGQGYGMAVTALRFFQGAETPTSLGLAGNNVAALTQDSTLQNHLFRYTLQQYAEPVSGGSGWERNLDVTQLLSRVGAELDPDTRVGDPYLLVLHDGASSLSLTLVPYRLLQIESDQFALYVYDPNLPLDNQRVVHFNTTQGSWQYVSQLPGTSQPVTLTGTSTAGEMDLRPLSAHQPTGLRLIGPPAVTLSALRSLGLVAADQPTAFLVKGCFSVSGAAALDNHPNTDGSCETTGSGNVSCLRVADGLNGSSGTLVCGIIPTPGNANGYQFNLYPDAQGKNSLTLISDQGPATTLRSTVAPGSTAPMSVTVGAGLDTLAVNPAPATDAKVQMSFAMPGSAGAPSYTVEVGGQTGQGQNLAAQVSGSTGQLTMQTQNPSSYDLTVVKLTSDGGSTTFQNPAVPVTGPAAQVDYGSWQGGLDPIPVVVDEAGDGFDNDTPVQFSNEFGKIYLPLLLR